MTSLEINDDWRPIPRNESCFVCGTENCCSLGLLFFSKENEVRAEWTPRAEHCSYEGIVHGGVVSAALDEILGWTGWNLFQKYYLTAELSVRFLKPIELARTYRINARLLKARSRFYIAEGDVIGENGAVHASAQGKFMVIDDVKAIRRDSSKDK